LSDLCFIVVIPLNPFASSSLYPSAFVGCWWGLRRDSSFDYLCIILVLGVFHGLCGVWIITGQQATPHNIVPNVGQQVAPDGLGNTVPNVG
jgi:hypothetical protein